MPTQEWAGLIERTGTTDEERCEREKMLKRTTRTARTEEMGRIETIKQRIILARTLGENLIKEKLQKKTLKTVKIVKFPIRGACHLESWLAQ